MDVKTNIYTKISIITPSYNQGQFFEETIQSVLGQNYPNLEYIIIDGGSTDNSIEIIQKYEKYLAYWESTKDRGQSHAINKGLSKATGEILAWLNSDDKYEAGTFNFIANYFYQNKDVDLLYGDVNIINKEGEIIKKKHEVDFDKAVGCSIGFGLIIPQQSSFWRRKIYDTLGGVKEDFYYNMDGEYSLGYLKGTLK